MTDCVWEKKPGKYYLLKWRFSSLLVRNLSSDLRSKSAIYNGLRLGKDTR